MRSAIDFTPFWGNVLGSMSPKDLTAILLPLGQLTDEQIRRVVFEKGVGDVLVRVAPLEAVKLQQVEVHEAKEGLPCEDPDLVGRLSANGWAAFVHVNHSASQAIVHGFVQGKPLDGFAGAPGPEFDAKLKEAVQAEVTLDQITAADDGSRMGIGVTSTRTMAIIRGAPLIVPPGTPTDFNSFVFHDRGAGMDEEGERLAMLTFDPRVARLLWTTPGRELSANLIAAPPGFYGPLEAVRDAAADVLAPLGDRTPEQAGLTDVRTLELCVLAAGRAFAGGDLREYWDERVLPMFALSGDPVIEPSEVEDLDDCDSVLHAMVEVQPFAAPPGGEGTLLQSLGDDELAPLAPWAKPGEEYRGTMFLLQPQRLLTLVRSLDGLKMRAAMEKFERAWYRAARPGQPEGDALDNFKRAKAEEGKADIERFLRDWTELRICLEIGAANQFQVALLFYEGA